jgi:hypothetical protein
MIFMIMKKIKLTESDLYRIVRRVLLEQEEEKRSFTFSPGTFKSFITSSSGERFVKHLNNKYDRVIVNEELDLSETPIQSLPDNLRVEGGLYLDGTSIQSLPDNLSVWGNLELSRTPIKFLPDNLFFMKDLGLSFSSIEFLPKNIRVNGNLYLVECENLQSLPDNLYVKAGLNLTETPIQYLPDNLHVGEWLSLRKTQIQSLPNNLRTGLEIDIINTPLSKNDELVANYRKKYRIVK